MARSDEVTTRRANLGPLDVSAQGLGCVSMSDFYGTPDERESIATINRALDLGISLLDTSDFYGEGSVEELVGRAIVGRRNDVAVATKFGLIAGDDPTQPVACGTPAHVRRACDASLGRLRVDHIDLYQQHRVDPQVPIEETVGALADLVRAGKVKNVGLTEVSAATVRRAHAVHPVAAVQSEWSLWSREIEADVVPTCRELGIGIVAYAPLGRGFLTGRYRAVADFEESDFRRWAQPRLADGNLQRNLAIVDALTALASRLDATPGQVALAWLHAQGSDVVPIPGTKRRSHLEENVAALELQLSAEDVEDIEASVPADAVVGDRYAPERLRQLDSSHLTGTSSETEADRGWLRHQD